MKNVKHVHDLKTHFVVTPHKGEPYKVPKNGLDKVTTTKIAAMCQGGQVQRLAFGDEVQDPNAPPATMDTVPTPPLELPPTPVGPPQAYGFDAGSALTPVPGSEMTDSNAPVPPAIQRAAEQSTLPIVPTPGENTPASSPDYTPPQFLAAPPAQVPPALALPKLPSAAGIFKDMDAQGDALRAGAAATAKEEGDKQAVYQDFQKQTAARDRAFQASVSAQDADYNRLKSDLESARISPNRYWHSMSAGGQVASVIGIVLSGMAQGVNGGSNGAMDVLNRNIQNDIEAQKEDLGKKQSLLAENIRKTGDMRQAEQMTRAQLLTNVQAQLSTAAAKYGGDKAKANADFLANQIAQQRDTLKYTIASQQANAAAQANQQKQLMDAYQRMVEGRGSIADEAVLGDKYGDKTVSLPNGARALAHSKEAAEAFRKSQVEIAPLQGHLARLRALGEMAAGGNFSQEARQAFDAERMAAVTEMGHLAGLNRFTHEEAERFEKRIRNLNDPLQFRSGFTAGLNGVQDEIDDKAMGDANTYLMRSKLAAPRGAK